MPHSRHLSTPETPKRSALNVSEKFSLCSFHWCGVSLLIFYSTVFWQNAHINHFSLSIFICRVRMCERVHCHSGLSTLFGPWATMSVRRQRWRRRRWRRRQKPPQCQQQTFQWPKRAETIIIIIYSDKKIHCIRNGKVFRLQCELSMTTRVDQVGMRMSTHNLAANRTSFTENSNLI